MRPRARFDGTTVKFRKILRRTSNEEKKEAEVEIGPGGGSVNVPFRQ